MSAGWLDIGSFLTCDGGRKSINSTFPNSSVSSVLHDNKSEVTNLAQIEALEIQLATIKFIPLGIKTHFPNLKALIFNSCGLLRVNKENLIEFGSSLEILSLQSNMLISLDAELFENNPSLKLIYFNGNPIRHIDSEFFMNLKKMVNVRYIAFNPAGCMNQYFYTSSGHNIITFKWNNEKCTNVTAKLEAQNLISDCLNEKIADSMNGIIENDKNGVSNLTKTCDSQDKLIEVLENNLKEMGKNMTNLIKDYINLIKLNNDQINGMKKILDESMETMHRYKKCMKT